MSVFDSYKPLRNALSILGIEDSLRVIWAYCQYLQVHEFRFPSDVQVDPHFLRLRPPQQWISEWHLEILAKEIILNGRNFFDPKYTLKSWPVLARLLNKLKEFENEIPMPSAERIPPLMVLNRIAYQQFIWQTNRPNSRIFIRNYLIYNEPTINTICVERIGVSVFDLYLCGMSFVGAYAHDPATTYPINSDVPTLTLEKIDKFLTFTCRTAAELKVLFKTEQHYDSSFFYAFNSLRAYPLIRIVDLGKELILAPLPTLLIWRFTAGLYYDLISDPRFAGAFGKSFQRYVGEAIQRASRGNRIRLLAETSFGSKKRRRDTIDWSAADDNAALFVECKAKRPSWDAKIALDNLAPLEQDIDILADAVVQTYKTINDYQVGCYPQFSFDRNLRIYPVIVTLEHWHLFGPTMYEIVDRSIRGKLQFGRVSLDVLEKMPFSIWHISELERGIQIINAVGIRPFMDGKIGDPQFRHWEWHSYMTDAFKGHRNEELFGREYDSMFAQIGL